ncbi:hypothetical protein HJG60_008873 [Phyllostomus discolor]|uniref:Uncharacterized protein n=1 Tax=Phyllostomus discolor TaxID=89673 RepID=A0A833YWM5_9CHIR|nr:hypothetical protein HJG60_008873 [Phyllostomus discolor]
MTTAPHPAPPPLSRRPRLDCNSLSSWPPVQTWATDHPTLRSLCKNCPFESGCLLPAPALQPPLLCRPTLGEGGILAFCAGEQQEHVKGGPGLAPHLHVRKWRPQTCNEDTELSNMSASHLCHNHTPGTLGLGLPGLLPDGTSGAFGPSEKDS